MVRMKIEDYIGDYMPPYTGTDILYKPIEIMIFIIIIIISVGIIRKRL